MSPIGASVEGSDSMAACRYRDEPLGRLASWVRQLCHTCRATRPEDGVVAARASADVSSGVSEAIARPLAIVAGRAVPVEEQEFVCVSAISSEVWPA